MGAGLSLAVYTAWAFATALPIIGPILRWTAGLPIFSSSDDQSLASFAAVLWHYRKTDFASFVRTHREALLEGQRTGNYVPGVCNYYRVMADLITITSGPFWHFVPMTKGLSRKDCHDKFHHTMVEYLGASKGNDILEIGCGFGEIGRQVASISASNVTGLTMADEEIDGGNARIVKASLETQCKMVKGDYHNLPFGNDTFDKVFGVYTLKYSADLKKAVSEAARVLKPGGKFVSYEILVTDKFDAGNAEHKVLSDTISHSTCMPSLWPASAFREAAQKAGLRATKEVDLCAAPNEEPWYSCFERTGIYTLLTSKTINRLVRLAETFRILPRAFTEFYEACLIHPAVDFVDSGRLGIVTGSVMMVWEKPAA